jgi:hypothetical protein
VFRRVLSLLIQHAKRQNKEGHEEVYIDQSHCDDDRTRKNKSIPPPLKITQSPECECTHGDQTTDHLLYECEILNKEREKLIAHTSTEDDWPVRKCELVNKYLKQFSFFVNSIDFEKL